MGEGRVGVRIRQGSGSGWDLAAKVAVGDVRLARLLLLQPRLLLRVEARLVRVRARVWVWGWRAGVKGWIWRAGV